MKTLLLITESFPYGTGENGFLETEVDKLSKSFHLILLPILPRKGERLQEKYQHIEMIRWHEERPRAKTREAIQRIDVREEIKGIIRSVKSDQKIDCLKAAIGYANRALSIRDLIRSVMAERRIDIIYTFWCTYATLGAIWLKDEYPSLKVISRFHGYDLYNERITWNRQLFRTEIAKKIDECYFACNYARDYFTKHWGKSGKIAYLGTKKHSRVSPSHTPVVLVSCSNMIELKRIELMIYALAKVNRRYIIEWRHIGDGDQREKLEHLADDLLKNHENINWHFTGNLEHTEVFRYYQEIKPSLFITASGTEGGCPVSIQEAFSMGIPCIGTDVGGIPDAVEDGVTGFLLSENPKPDEIAKSIERFCELDDSSRKRFQKAAYLRWSEKFNAEENAGCFCKQVNELIGK